ncbi:MAG: serine protease [Planctomycetota bacterium]|nr:serine protease [Planctomycetota bacterium]
MPETNWPQAVEHLRPHIVRISTPSNSGTGFLISNTSNSNICGVATAAHVVDHAHYWEEPIRIDHEGSGNSIVIRRDARAVLLDTIRDTAAIIFDRGQLPLPSSPLTLAPKDKYFKVGNELAWLGFPAVSSANLCFFSGRVSAWLERQSAYLVDGVAINGVSGGPAFFLAPEEGAPVILVGVVSAYVPNRATGGELPGLSVVRDVSHFHELAPTFASLDQAREAEPTNQPEPPKPVGEGGGEAARRRTS